MTRQDRDTQRLQAGAFPAPAHVQDLIATAADLVIWADAQNVICGISVNPNCASLGCLDHWVNRPIEHFLTEESQEKFALRLKTQPTDTDKSRSLELNHVDNATWEFPIRYTLHEVESGGVLMLGRDMQPIAEVQQRLVKEQMARERDLQRLRGERTFYRVVLEAAETPLILVEPQKGRIRDLNGAAAALLGTKVEALAGNAFAQAFEGRRRGELLDTLQAASAEEGGDGVEVTARRNGKVLTLHPTYFRAAGELFLLCRLMRLDQGEPTGHALAQSLSALFSASSDAIALTDGRGDIREANEAFLVLADAAQMRDVKDRGLSDFLARGAVDFKLIVDQALHRDRLRSYSAQFTSVVGTRTSVEISVARLDNAAGESGFGFIIRDVTPTDLPEESSGPVGVSDDAMKNVMDLVGTASLKELVSATSDVIEKLCIETAVQLTGNNRVAAAEMLGLSRQSLYVKLRKHGLLSSDGVD
ncbi:MAG: transcriptional regulator PpsR [Pseudomonadota bacterium]